jgi:DnaJ-class molecular chaperone
MTTPDDMRPGDEVPADSEQGAPNICPRCGGSGEQDGERCDQCGGTGEVVEAVGGG